MSETTPHYAAHRTAVCFMNGPYQMQRIGEAATFADAEKFAAALDALARRAADGSEPHGRAMHLERVFEAGFAAARVPSVDAAPSVPAAQPTGGCEFDTDGDGNCPIHPKGCPADQPTREPSAFVEVRTTACHAGSDGDCNWSECPQLHDGEPKASGRHCPLDSIAKVHAPSVLQPTREPEGVALLPCPFCGGTPIRARTLRDGCKHGEPDAYAYNVNCITCAAEGGWAKSVTGGDRWWNRRAAPEPAKAEPETAGPRYEVWGGIEVHWMTGPYFMRHVGTADTPEDAEKFVKVLNGATLSAAPVASPATPSNPERDFDAGMDILVDAMREYLTAPHPSAPNYISGQAQRLIRAFDRYDAAVIARAAAVPGEP